MPDEAAPEPLPRTGSWQIVETAAGPPPEGASVKRHNAVARRLHRFFAVTAIPCGAVLGVVCLLLRFNALVEAHIVGRVVAGFCVLQCVIMTGLLVYLHLSAFTDPVQQRRIIRILVMAPLYGAYSLLALWKHDVAPVMGLLRDAYESYVIYTFYNLLIGYLGGEEAALAAKPRYHRVPCLAPLCWFGHFPLTRSTLRVWKLLLVQYMLLKPFLAAVAIVLMARHSYDEGSWSFTNAHVYFVMILNVSVTCAFTALVYLFVEFKDSLEHHHPLGKFAAVKAVVFLTFWQSVLLGSLVQAGLIQGSREGLWTPAEVSTGIQDFLICLEMLFMCYMHRWVFPESPYVPVSGYHAVNWRWLLYLLSIRDVLEDSLDTVAGAVREDSLGPALDDGDADTVALTKRCPSPQC